MAVNPPLSSPGHAVAWIASPERPDVPLGGRLLLLYVRTTRPDLLLRCKANGSAFLRIPEAPDIHISEELFLKMKKEYVVAKNTKNMKRGA